MDYLYAFAQTEIIVDNVDETLPPRFVKEANAVFENVGDDVKGSNTVARGYVSVASDGFVPTRFEVFKYMLPTSLLEKVQESINRVLVARNRKTVEVAKIMAVIAQHVPCSAYGESVSTVSNRDNSGIFYQVGVDAGRHKDVWSALSSTKQRRGRVEHKYTGWRNKPSRGNALITEMEQECAAVNRTL